MGHWSPCLTLSALHWSLIWTLILIVPGEGDTEHTRHLSTDHITEESCPLAPLPGPGLTHAETLSHCHIRPTHLRLGIKSCIAEIFYFGCSDDMLIFCLIHSHIICTYMRWHMTCSPVTVLCTTVLHPHLTCSPPHRMSPAWSHLAWGQLVWARVYLFVFSQLQFLLRCLNHSHVNTTQLFWQGLDSS